MTTGDRKRNYPFAPKVTSQTVVAESAEGVAEAINETEAPAVPAEVAPVAEEGIPDEPGEPDAEPEAEGDEE